MDCRLFSATESCAGRVRWTRHAIGFNKPLTRACCRLYGRAYHRMERRFAVLRRHGLGMSRSDRLQQRETSDTFRSCNSDRREPPDAESRGVRVHREFCASVGSSWRRSLLAESIDTDTDRRPGFILLFNIHSSMQRVLSADGDWTVSAPYT